jgi:ABC-type transport system substrate-binding protein/DNA-binding SARP family transcriptional activator/streptogramin lyase
VIDYRLLGPIEAGVNGRVLDIAGHKQLALLAVLVLRANQPVSRDVLVDWLWGEHPPPGVQHTLDVHISRLRKTLESAAGQQVVLTRPGAYLLRAAADSVDMRRFERLAKEGHRALAENAPDRAAAELSEALALWRGAPLADVSDEAFAQPEIARLNDLRMGIIEDRIEADLALGRHGGVVSELGALVAEQPLRERLYQLLMVALYRCGRQSEALAVYQSARLALVDELGIEPSPALQRIERAILAQDGSLDPPPRAALAPAPGQIRDGRFPQTSTVRRVRLTAAAGASLALILALLFFGSGPRASLVSAAPDTVAVINASRADLTSVVGGIGRPGGIAYGAGAAWVTDTADGMLLRINRAGQVVDRIPVGRGPAGVVAGAGEIWVANEFDNTVSQVNPRTGTAVAPPIDVGGGPAGLAYGYGSVWAANVTDATLSRIDPGSGTVTATIPLGSTPDGVAAGAGGIWVASGQAGRLLLVDPRRGRVTRAFPVGVTADDVAVGAGSIWVSDPGGAVARLNPVTGRVQQIKVGGSPAAIAFADGAVWVANGLGSVFRIDPRTRLVRSVHLGNEPSGLGIAGGSVLVTVLPSLASHRGGTLTLVSSLTLTAAGHDWSDPALAWDGYDWQMLAMTNDGLVGYRRVGGPAGDQLVPDLARYLPVTAGNGTAYTFRLRAGIRYSNGRLVRPEDFRRALERVFILNHGGAPAAYFYSGIVGAAACERHPQSCTLSRGIVTNDRAGTVTFHLTAPDPDFLDKLALPFADAVPAGTPDRQLTAAQIPATGPYLTRSFQPTRAWVLVRNPRFRQWSALAQPGGYPDRIVLRLGAAPGAAVDAVEHGRADVLSSPPPVSRIHELTTRYANLLHTDPVGGTYALFLNTRVRPFNVLAARRAVNYAIDRNTMIQLIGGPTAAQPTCQILPPTLPGYQPYCPYTINPGPSGAWQAPDLARAQQLARHSGTVGDKVTLVTDPRQPLMPGPAAGRYLVSVLREIGYRASLRAITSPQTYANIVGNSRDRIQVGEFSWYADYPAPWDFFGLLFSCQSLLLGNPANLNPSEYCSPRIDAQVQQALADQARSPDAARLLWANIDREIAGQAPWVPLYNPRALVVLSARVRNYQFHPLWGLLIDQLWVR